MAEKRKEDALLKIGKNAASEEHSMGRKPKLSRNASSLKKRGKRRLSKNNIERN